MLISVAVDVICGWWLAISGWWLVICVGGWQLAIGTGTITDCSENNANPIMMAMNDWSYTYRYRSMSQCNMLDDIMKQ